jgi:hypothetical protein
LAFAAKGAITPRAADPAPGAAADPLRAFAPELAPAVAPGFDLLMALCACVMLGCMEVIVFTFDPGLIGT